MDDFREAANTRSMFKTLLIDAFDRQPPEPGVADLFAFDAESALLRSFQAAAILGMLADSDQPRFRKVQLLVQSPRTDSRLARLDEILDHQLRLASDNAPSSTRTRGRIELKPYDGSPRAVLEALDEAFAGSAIVIPDVDLVPRSTAPSSVNHIDPSRAGWSDEATELATRVVSAVRHTGAYVLMTTTSELYVHGTLHPELAKIEGLGVFTFEDNSSLLELRAEIQALHESLKRRRMAEALSRVDTLKALIPPLRALLRSSVLAHGGLIATAQSEYDLVTPVLDVFAPSLSLFAAKVALDIGMLRYASENIRQLLVRKHDESQLEAALQLAMELGDLALGDEIALSLAAALPDSDVLRQFRIGRSLQIADLDAAIGHAATDTSEEGAELLDALRAIASARGEGDVLDASAAIAALRALPESGREYGLEVVARFLELQHRYSEAAAVLGAGDDQLSPARASRLLRLLRHSILYGGGDIEHGQMLSILSACLSTLSDRPGDWQLRLAMSRILDPTLLGGQLHPIAATLMFGFANAEVTRPTLTRRYSDGRCPPEQLSEYLRTAFEWIKQNGGVVVSGEAIQITSPAVAPASIVASLQPVIEERARQTASPEDLEHLRLLVALVTNLNGGLADQVLDIETIRVAAVRLAESGHTQAARDFAEEALMAAGASPIRARHAWYSYADIYARIGYHAEALTALACALASRARPSWEEQWQEAALAFRLMRDIGAAALGEPFLQMQVEAVRMLELAPEYVLRIETLVLQSEARRVLENGRISRQRVESLLPRAVAHVARVLELDKERAPAAMLLASLLRLSEESGVEIAPNAREMLEESCQHVSPAVGQLLRAEATRHPSVSQLESLAESSEVAKFPDDLGYELNRVAMIARRTLNDAGIDAARAVLAIELAADQTRRVTGAANLICRAADLTQVLEELSNERLAIVLLGLSSVGLVRLVFSRGAVDGPLQEPEHVFSTKALFEWSRTYPYEYGRANKANIFYTSTQELAISALPPRCLIVADIRLQQFPLNLFNVGGELAGKSARLASCPSISWLSAIRRRSAEDRSGRAAWIPLGSTSGGLGPLEALAARLEDCFRDHHVGLTTSLTPPGSSEGFALLIVGAHGAVAATNRYFKTMADDDGNLITSEAIVQCAGNSKIVVLFVCSGGRLDSHPEANALVGLPGSLLGAGVRAVMAPAWPLEVSVPPVWLPEFLACLDRGEAVIDACFSANLAVSSRLLDDPRLSLAMTVYGDPETRL